MGDDAAPLRLLSPIEEPIEAPLEELAPVRLPPLPVLLDPPLLPEPPEPPDRLDPMPDEPLPEELPVVLPAVLPPAPVEPVEPLEPDVPMELDAGEAADEVEPGGVVPDGSEPGVDEALEDGFMGDVDM